MGGGVLCKACGSVNQKKFSAEMAIHFLELENINKPVVWVFPEVVVCLIGALRNSLFQKNCVINPEEESTVVVLT